MKTTFLKTSCFVLFVVVAFVYFANPIYAKASTADMDYIETDMSTAEVKALFSGAAAFIPAAFVIIGFIALMYCTLRNVNTPVQFSSSDTFIDKCRSLGQYCVDNCTDSLKNVLYSVYEYCEDNNITSITGFGTFLALNIGKFISAFSSWINGSLINNVSSVGNGLLNQFVDSVTFNIPTSSIDVSSFNNFSSIPLSSCLAFCRYRQYYYTYCVAFYYTGNIPSDVVCLTFSNGYGFYRLVDGVYVYATDITNAFLCSGLFNVSNPSAVNWSTSLTTISFNMSQYYFYWTGSDSYTSLSTYGMLLDQFVTQFGTLYSVAGNVRDNINAADVSRIQSVEDVINPAVDNVYVPQAPAIPIDLVGTWSDLADALAHGGDAADVTQEEKIAAYVPSDVALQLDSAVSDTMNVIGGGNYVFPSLKGVWKYAEYFFNTLKGWGQFVGGCLNAVTVGEGGLSWLFYGGFIILVCGGVVGKILLG